jgi:hypothetical protein
MHGIYSYIPETNHVSTVYSVAAVLYLQSVLHVMLFSLRNMFCSLHQHFPQYICAVHSVVAFCTSLISCIPGTLLRYCLSNFEMAPIAAVVTGVTLAFTLHYYYYYYYYYYYVNWKT